VRICRAKSVVDEFVYRNRVHDGVTITWSCGDREHTLAPYSEAIKGFENLGPEHVVSAIRTLNENFTESEIQLLRDYLDAIETKSFQHRQLVVEEVVLPLTQPWYLDDDYPKWGEIELCALTSSDLVEFPKTLSDLQISGGYSVRAASCKGYSLDDRDRDLIDRFSTGLADELSIEPAVVMEGVTSLCQAGFIVTDHQTRAAEWLF
jgi:hypothetical protein